MSILFVEPTVEIQNAEYVVQEGIGTLNVPLRRRGDLKPLIKIVCVTVPGEYSIILILTTQFLKTYDNQNVSNVGRNRIFFGLPFPFKFTVCIVFINVTLYFSLSTLVIFVPPP